MRRTLPVLAGFLLAGGAVFLALQAESQEKPKDAQAPAEEYKIPPEDAQRPNPVKATPEGLAQAKKLYGYDCAMCHGPQGDGKGELAETMKLTLLDWREPASLKDRTDGELFYIISNGKGKMVGEGDRHTPEKRWHLVNLVRSFAKKDSGNAPKPAPPKQQ